MAIASDMDKGNLLFSIIYNNSHKCLAETAAGTEDL